MKWLCSFLLLIEVPGSSPSLDAAPRALPAAKLVEHYAAYYAVPVELVEAIIDEESGWNAYAISNKGAVGMMQLMPETARRFGVHDRFRVEENIRGGVAYLAWLKREFRGDLRLMTAAYFVGEKPIRARGLAYSSRAVQAYVTRVACRYRYRRWAQATQQTWTKRPKVR
ncbi:MAG: lytic transglycosylase domain-containing protein [Acidobacteria bacterium]|nr:lytic transglycosylase domain-containing protein [Acidobacteriota bacterium]